MVKINGDLVKKEVKTRIAEYGASTVVHSYLADILGKSPKVIEQEAKEEKKNYGEAYATLQRLIGDFKSITSRLLGKTSPKGVKTLVPEIKIFARELISAYESVRYTALEKLIELDKR